MIKKIILFVWFCLIIFFCAGLYGQPDGSAGRKPLVIREVDHTPSGRFKVLEMPNTTLTDNFDGSITYTPATNLGSISVTSATDVVPLTLKGGGAGTAHVQDCYDKDNNLVHYTTWDGAGYWRIGTFATNATIQYQVPGGYPEIIGGYGDSNLWVVGGKSGQANWGKIGEYGFKHYTGGYMELGVSGDTTSSLGQLYINNSVGAAKPVLTLKGAAAQSGNLQEWQGSAGNILAKVSSSGQFCISNITPLANSLIHIAASNTAASMYFDTYDNGTSNSNFYFRKSNTDTIGTATTTGNGDQIGLISFQGVDSGNNFDGGSWITVTQVGASGTRVPCKVEFETFNATGLNDNQFVLNTDGTWLLAYNGTIGKAAAGIDYTLTFDGENSDGLITWMEDENEFLFGNNVNLGAQTLTTTGAISGGVITGTSLTLSGVVEGTNIINHAEGQIIEAFKRLATDPANIKGLWMIDQTGDTTSITDRSEAAHTLDLSANASTLTPDVQGLARNVAITGPTSYYDTVDHADFSITTDKMTIIWAGVLTNATSSAMWAKLDLTTGSVKAEYAFRIAYGDKLVAAVYNNGGTAAYIARSYNIAITGDENQFHVYAMTYSGGTTDAAIKIYRDGVQVDDTNAGRNSYTAAIDTTTKAGSYYLNSNGIKVGALKGKPSALCYIKSEEWTAVQIKRISTQLLAWGNNLI